MISTEALVTWLDEGVVAWHDAPDSARALLENERAGISDAPDVTRAIGVEHLINIRLWHQEDEARRPDVSDTDIARTKRVIDGLNQRRNDTIETIDDAIIAHLGEGALRSDAPLHSETPGAIIDRLSILSLKIYHMREETLRENADPEHRSRCAEKLVILEEQRGDLAGCLAILMDELQAGNRRFRRYRQFKMYNDPELNPAVRAAERPAER